MSSQNYRNHRAIDRKYISIGAIAAIALLLTGVSMTDLGGPYMTQIAMLCIIVALSMLFLRTRAYGVRLQDRIIRLEMQMRLTRLGLDEHIPRLSMKQLIGLRFASDAELPELIATVLAEDIQKPDEIKKRVKDWQPDVHRI